MNVYNQKEGSTPWKQQTQRHDFRRVLSRCTAASMKLRSCSGDPTSKVAAYLHHGPLSGSDTGHSHQQHTTDVNMQLVVCRLKGSGWPQSMYGVSKLCETAYTRVLAEELQPNGVTVNACCPGYVNTDMTSHRGVKTLAEGADTPVWLALDPPKGVTGKLFGERKELSF